MGPRGGDEINRLIPGANYGWPLTSRGVHYNGRPVDGRGLGIDFDLDDLEQPVVDLTPSVAVSSFVFYDGGRVSRVAQPRPRRIAEGFRCGPVRVRGRPGGGTRDP